MIKIFFFPFLLLFLWFGPTWGATPLPSLLPERDLPEGWTRMGRPKIYTQKTLFHRVNGQAELFFKYGFQRSVSGIYQNRKNPQLQIEADIYEMGSVLQAFGIYSRFRSEDRPGGIGLDSYFDDQSAYFYKGRYFIILIATVPDLFSLKQLATSISTKITDASPPPREIRFFPAEGLKPGSIQYFPEGLLGRKYLGRGFQATYMENFSDGEREMKLFIALFKNSNEAGNALRHYREELVKRGKVYPSTPDTLKGEDFYQGQVLAVQKRSYLLGAIGFREKGDRLLATLIKNIH